MYILESLVLEIYLLDNMKYKSVKKFYNGTGKSQ